MSHVAYVNGRYVRHAEAAVHIEDRGYQFADAVYEVIAVWNEKPVDYGAHIVRLQRSLREIGISAFPNPAVLTVIIKEVIRRNRLRCGSIYLQVSRGVAPRNHVFPSEKTSPSLVVTARYGIGPNDDQIKHGVRVSTEPDLRWGRRDIKSVGLLPNVLAKQRAVEGGAYEALLIDGDGTLTEATAANLWVLDQDKILRTRPLGPEILAGVTRETVLSITQSIGLTVIERPFSLEEVLAAQEVFLSGTTVFVLSIIQVNDAIIANGLPGSCATQLRALYLEHLNNPPTDAWKIT